MFFPLREDLGGGGGILVGIRLEKLEIVEWEHGNEGNMP
jgi:hypothetical protein